MKNHPGHFWVCMWLWLIFLLMPASNSGEIKRIADTLSRIETQMQVRP